MKKSFMTRVLAVSLSAAMAFSMSSASNLVTASAASTVNLKTTFKTLKVNQKYKLTLKKNTLNWKITKVTTSNKKICTVYGKTASSVMLKGKGVGRAKIKVKVKTTKRKYPKNIKWMTCTANVKADDTATTEAFKATSAVANSTTEVRVSFNQAIDTPDATNFAISDGVTVSKAELAKDKKSVVLTIAGADFGKNYDLTVTGIKVAGKAQAEQKLTFTTPASEVKYPMTLEAKDTILKSDGQDQTVVTFTIKDAATGNPITDKNVEVAFTASLGKFAEQRVSIQNGVATVMYTSEALKETQVAKITATVVESRDNKDLMGLNTATSITLTPNPGDTSIGAIITSATAPTADRVIAYFNQKVKASDFKTKSGKIDKSKFECVVKSGLDNGWVDVDKATTTHEVIGILDVDTAEENALQLLVNKPMVDNTNVSVRFKNNTETDSIIQADNTVFFKLTDARQPAVLNATSEGMREIKIEFSEAVLPSVFCNGDLTSGEKRFAADNINNYLIDGEPLSNWWVNETPDNPDNETPDESNSKVKKTSTKDDKPANATAEEYDGRIKVGSYRDGEDTRHVVTIKVGKKRYLNPGTHRISISNVGDWAAKTDRERNIVNTEGFDFVVPSNDLVPTFEVTPQSPEQWLVTFNSPVSEVNNSDTITTPNSDDIKSILRLQQYSGGTWVDISDTDADRGKNPIRVSKIDNDKNQYIVEVTNDWTEVYDTVGTKTNYFNYDLRLHMDANTIVNLANNKQNAAIDVPLTGDIMKSPDTVSPVIGEVVQAVDESGYTLESYNVTMSEPVKLSDGSNGANGANGEGLTPSQTQRQRAADDGRLGVPAPSAQFISADNGQTVNGVISSEAFIDAEDMTINIEPETQLSAGEWRLVISSISDDYGNTASTVTHTINVTRETATSDFRVVWAAVSNNLDYDGGESIQSAVNAGRGNYIFVKFNKPVTMTGNSTNAQVTGNYTINGNTLPTGTEIAANIKGYDDHDNVTDSITIKLPTGNFNWNDQIYNVDSRNAMLNISKAITSTTGSTLSNGGMIRIPFQYGRAVTDGEVGSIDTNDTTDVRINSLKASSDAVWGNHADERLAAADANDETKVKEYFNKLKAALANDQYRKIILTNNIDLDDTDSVASSVFGKGHTLTINRAVDIDLNGYNINGNVVVSTTDCVDKVRIMNSVAALSEITGYSGNKENVPTLKVTAGSVKDFVIENVRVNKANEGYAVNINDVYKNSFVNNGTINGDVVITDSNTAGFDAGTGKMINGDILINTKGEVNLEGDFTGDDYKKCKIEVNQAAVVRVCEGAKLSNRINVNANSKDARIIVLNDSGSTELNGSSIHAYTVVRVTIPQGTNVELVIEKVGAEFKSVDRNNKDLTSKVPASEAVDVNTTNGLKPGNSNLKLALENLNVLDGKTSTEANAAVGNQTVTVGAIETTATGIKVSELQRTIESINNISDGNSEQGTRVEYEFSATYTLVTTSVATKKTIENGDTVIVSKEKPATNGTDRVRVVITAKDKATKKVVSEVTKYIDITNP